MNRKKHRSLDSKQGVIAFSVSYEPRNLLARGLGLDHLKDLVTRVSRPLLRNNLSLAYAGHWKESDENFTYHFLRLISAEQEDNSLNGPDTNRTIGKLYNHSAWPHYLAVTPRIEAQWINCCRVVRMTQQQAGLADLVADQNADQKDDRTTFNAAVTLSVMRQRMMQGSTIDSDDAPSESIPPISVRVILGGKGTGYSGFMPGLFEEALEALRNSRPLYILGGFGGASGWLADAILGPAGQRPKELTLAWHVEQTPALAALLESAGRFGLPTCLPSVERQFDDLFAFVEQARMDPSGTLRTGLSGDETRELLRTCSIGDAVRLTRRGMEARLSLSTLAA